MTGKPSLRISAKPDGSWGCVSVIDRRAHNLDCAVTRRVGGAVQPPQATREPERRRRHRAGGRILAAAARRWGRSDGCADRSGRNLDERHGRDAEGQHCSHRLRARLGVRSARLRPRHRRRRPERRRHGRLQRGRQDSVTRRRRGDRAPVTGGRPATPVSSTVPKPTLYFSAGRDVSSFVLWPEGRPSTPDIMVGS